MRLKSFLSGILERETSCSRSILPKVFGFRLYPSYSLNLTYGLIPFPTEISSLLRSDFSRCDLCSRRMRNSAVDINCHKMSWQRLISVYQLHYLLYCSNSEVNLYQIKGILIQFAIELRTNTTRVATVFKVTLLG